MSFHPRLVWPVFAMLNGALSRPDIEALRELRLIYRTD
jgi:hypothetical protein